MGAYLKKETQEIYLSLGSIVKIPEVQNRFSEINVPFLEHYFTPLEI
jgi:hypothetical protein